MKDFFKLRESMTDFTNRDYKPGATDQEKRNAIKRKRADVEEGTWAIPETPKQKKELKNILKKPLPAGKDGDNASDKMYGIIGDDELFDDFYLAGKKNPKTDVRPLIKKAMKRLGIKEEVEEVDEGIKHDRYMRAHGKKAPAKEIATWMFTTKAMGDVDDNDKKVVWRSKQPMKLGQAGKEAMKALGTKDVYVMEGKAYGPTGIAYAVKTGHPDEVDPKTKKKYPERQTSKYKKQWAKNNKESIDKISEEYPDGFSQTWRNREGMVFERNMSSDVVEIDEATDIFNKGGIHVTRFAMGKGKLGFQFNFGKIGRYIQVPLEKLSVLDQAVKMAKKAGKTKGQGDLPIADDVNEEGGAGLFGTTTLRKKYEDETPGQGQKESTAAYAKSLEKIARDKQLASISDKDKQTLMKIAAMLAKEKKK